ncbi:MAG: TIGR03086 family protein [Marmoricola sp.]|nr:TIGR03086 family protein [Marmoricola sp.]
MSTTTPPVSVAVLDSAVTYTHATLQRARRSPLTLPTPCADWDLGTLLLHMEDSLATIGEAAELGRVDVADNPRRDGADRLVDRIVQRACVTRSAWLQRLTSAPIAVGDLALGRDTLVLVGALEIAVHGWDVAEATGWPSPLPEDLAVRLYDVALAVVTPTERGRRFGPAVDVPPTASAGRRLLAHLGRG